MGDSRHHNMPTYPNGKAPPLVSPFRTDILKGKVALVTGGGTGIGFGICRQFGLHGAKVCFMGRRLEVLQEAEKKLAAEGIEAKGIQGDVRDWDKCQNTVKQAVAAFGRLDILVNCAAGNFMAPAEDLSVNGFKTVIDIDLNGSFQMCKAAFGALKESGDSLIINISATLHYKARPFQIHAASAKAGIDNLTRTLGIEWAEHGIRSVGIAPGPVAGTEGGPTGRVFGNGQEWTDKKVRMLCPAGFFGEVDDIAMSAVFMASQAGRWITSETLVVDGGQWHDVGPMMYGMKKMIQAKSNKEKEERQPRSKL